MATTKKYPYLLFWMMLLTHSFTLSLAANVEIDQNHLSMYPYCGRKAKSDQATGSSGRVVNSRDAQTEYPWVVFVERINMRKSTDQGTLQFVGSVITDR